MGKGKKAVNIETSALQVFGIENNNYFGTRNEDAITGIMVSRSTMDGNIFASYFKRQNMEELVTVQVGANTSVTSRQLTRREALDFKMVEAEWNEAISMADQQLVNDVFDRFRGKA
jgi:RecB family endonuclease NucS